MYRSEILDRCETCSVFILTGVELQCEVARKSQLLTFHEMNAYPHEIQIQRLRQVFWTQTCPVEYFYTGKQSLTKSPLL